MTGVIEPAQVGPCGESSRNVRSLRMRFESGSHEGVSVDKSMNVEVPPKALESIKRFESLAKKQPGRKFNDSLGRSLSRSASAKGSIRVGSLRHKFESLANRSLSSDLFNAPGEADDDSKLNNVSNKLSPVSDGPELESPKASEMKSEESMSLEGEAEISDDVKPTDEVDAIGVSATEPATDFQGESVAAVVEDANTVSSRTDDSFEDSAPALCLKDEMEEAEAKEVHPEKIEELLDDPQIEPNDVDKKEASENLLESIDGFDAPPVDIKTSSDTSSVPCIDECSLNIVTVPIQDRLKDVVPDEDPSEKQDNAAVENASEAKVLMDGEVARPGNIGEPDSEPEQVPIERREPSPRKRPGLFRRLLMCGTAV